MLFKDYKLLIQYNSPLIKIAILLLRNSASFIECVVKITELLHATKLFFNKVQTNLLEYGSIPVVGSIKYE